MSRRLHLSLLTLICTTCCCFLLASGRYAADWNDLDKRPNPAWFDDAKFGIFINWGLYSVPAWGPVGQSYAEWYWWDLHQAGSPTQLFHNRTYGPDFRFQDFASLFKAEMFDPDYLADLVVRSGAKYAVPNSKHHSGYCMWPSAESWNWNSVDTGPHRDILGDTLKALEDRGIYKGIYFSLLEWYHPLYQANPSTQGGIGNITAYVEQVMWPQMLDLVESYSPDLLWTDGDFNRDSATVRGAEWVAYLYNDSPVKDRIVVNDRYGSDTRQKHGGFATMEYSSRVAPKGRKWEENSGIDIFSFGFNRNTPVTKYYSTDYLLKLLIRSIANGGNFLLNIGPRPDGTIPLLMQERLLDIGDWLAINGEAVYATQMWRVTQEGALDNTTIRYTASKQQPTVIYAHLLEWPTTSVAILPSPVPPMNRNAGVISILGWNGTLEWKPLSRQNGGIAVQLPLTTPGNIPCDHIWVLKLQNFS